MTKRNKKIDKDDPRQMNLLDFLQAAAELRDEAPLEGQMRVQPQLSHAMGRAIRKSELSRWEIAGQMSHLVGMEITKAMLDSWTAESKEHHRPPAEFLPAFCAVTGDREPMQILADAAGLFCLPGPDALRAEIQRLSEDEKKLKAEKRKRELFLREMEGGRS
jgi:hypothetical protein